MSKVPVSIVVPVRNAATTVIFSLESIIKQTYPIREIIVVDNASTDNSIQLVKKFSQATKIPVFLVARKINKGIGGSFNTGVKRAKSPFVILMHSDCSLPTKNEVERLIKPFTHDKNVVATYPTIFLLEKLWNTYDFWEKFFFAREVGRGTAGFATKFDCVRRDAYMYIGGVDVVNFGVGNEDGDLHDKLKSAGKVVKSEAIVTHLQFLGSGYSFQTLLKKKRHVARSYGRAIRMRGSSLLKDGLILLVKPTLALIPFIPHLQYVGVILLILYSFFYTKKLYISPSTHRDPRILLVPLLNIFFVYYETFWIIEAFFLGKNKIE